MRQNMFGQPMSKDMLCIVQVREKMAEQWDADIQRNRLAKTVCNDAHKLDFHVTMLKRDSKNHSLLLGDLVDDTKNVNKRLSELLSRDPRQLPQEAVDAAKRASKRNPW